ncbi:hypothetical protein [Clostridium sp. ATCC 25772]|uniref:hypothetical protein n=1 Tax=Clostridium sp. ATCC 25772 TaxID=1676991 RepID=UPI000780ED22|nr:hypothetical protein [Clostridium sp. ATCC 25772]
MNNMVNVGNIKKRLILNIILLILGIAIVSFLILSDFESSLLLGLSFTWIFINPFRIKNDISILKKNKK